LSHLQDFTASGEDVLIFTGPKNAQLRRSNFSKAWRDATKAANLTDFHFHDLRHAGNTLAGAAGASLRELMERMGHSTTRAALIYQHRTSERDKLIADAMGKLAKAELRQRGRPSGTQRARKGKGASRRQRRRLLIMPELEGSCRAGDENRTRTISLGMSAGVRLTSAAAGGRPGHVPLGGV
jgi:hypothetical protein